MVKIAETYQEEVFQEETFQEKVSQEGIATPIDDTTTQKIFKVIEKLHKFLYEQAHLYPAIKAGKSMVLFHCMVHVFTKWRRSLPQI